MGGLINYITACKCSLNYFITILWVWTSFQLTVDTWEHGNVVKHYIDGSRNMSFHSQTGEQATYYYYY